jgi:CRP/FNR family transcriptional regulator
MVSFQKLLDEVPSLGPRLLEMTFDELDAARTWMMVLGQKNSTGKNSQLSVYYCSAKCKITVCRDGK